MNILWISFLGSWTLPLLNSIKPNNRVGIIIPRIGTKQNSYDEKEGISFYSIAFSQNECYTKMTERIFNKYKTVINEFRPDIIHVHGTEKNLAQIQNFIENIPIVISIQGILTGCKPYTYNYINKKEVYKYKTLKNIFGFGSLNLMYRSILKGESYETDILNSGKYFIGRTNWDKAHIMFHNPNAQYFLGEEILRNEFYNNANSWDIHKCQPHTIFMPSGFNPIKGMHLAIETIHLLKQYYPDVLLVIPGLSTDVLKKSKLTSKLFGEEYIIYIRQKIKAYKLENNILFLPRLNASEMVKQMQNANVFLSPSSVDNSPNAVGEAMMIGIPIVTTPVGGVTSFLEDEKTALFAPAGDPYMMAFQIKRIFENPNLAALLRNNAYPIALKRHNVESTVKQYIDIYQHIISINN